MKTGQVRGSAHRNGGSTRNHAEIKNGFRRPTPFVKLTMNKKIALRTGPYTDIQNGRYQTDNFKMIGSSPDFEFVGLEQRGATPSTGKNSRPPGRKPPLWPD